MGIVDAITQIGLERSRQACRDAIRSSASVPAATELPSGPHQRQEPSVTDPSPTETAIAVAREKLGIEAPASPETANQQDIAPGTMPPTPTPARLAAQQQARRSPLFSSGNTDRPLGPKDFDPETGERLDPTPPADEDLYVAFHQRVYWADMGQEPCDASCKICQEREKRMRDQYRRVTEGFGSELDNRMMDDFRLALRAAPPAAVTMARRLDGSPQRPSGAPQNSGTVEAKTPAPPRGALSGRHLQTIEPFFLSSGAVIPAGTDLPIEIFNRRTRGREGVPAVYDNGQYEGEPASGGPAPAPAREGGEIAKALAEVEASAAALHAVQREFGINVQAALDRARRADEAWGDIARKTRAAAIKADEASARQAAAQQDAGQ